MESTWETLSRELAYHRIKLIDEKSCLINYNGKDYTLPISKAIKFINKQIQSNIKVFEEIWMELSHALCQPCSCMSGPVDIRLANLFCESIKDLCVFSRALSEDSPRFRQFLFEKGIAKSLKIACLKDLLSFSPEIITVVPDFKIAISWTFRKNCTLDYITHLLMFAAKGQQYVCGKTIKTARGISGPWANLDLPTAERCFPWSDIEEEVRGRERDKERQRRYTKGLENYNNYGKVGEGYYWRELRNEPFSWYNKDSDSPYPGRNTLSKW